MAFWWRRISGWHLPSSTGTGSYTTLVQNYVGRESASGVDNIHTTVSIPIFSFVRSGFYNHNGNLVGQSSNGAYWLSMLTGKDIAGNLRFISTLLSSRSNDDRGHGLALRCLAR